MMVPDRRVVMRSSIPVRATISLAISLTLLLSGPSIAQIRKPAATTSAVTDSALSQAIRAAITQSLDQLQQDGDFAKAQTSLRVIFDQVIAFADLSDRSLFRDSAFVLRLVQLVGQADAGTRMDLLKYLRDNPDLARALAFLVQPTIEKPAEVFALLERLRQRHGEMLNKYANLAAAICVVHDRPYFRQINENRDSAPDPLLLFEYFVANESKMYFGVRDVPAELLIYVVDSTASIVEMQWALQRYAGDKNVGSHFFDVDYDTANFKEGKPKKVDAAGWNLPNILKYGGVCADQAYFAMSIGKAIGVPTTYTRGASGEVSHAWVGFLQSDGRRAWWNFQTGRYEAYQGIGGIVDDPQTRRPIPDSYVSLLADFVSARELDRQAAASLTNAAKRMMELQKAGRALQPPCPAGLELTAARKPETAAALALLEAGLSASPGYAEGWFTLQQFAADGRLSLEDKKRWEGVLNRLCGQRYPDFYLAILGPMIETVADVKDQNALWNAAFRNFSNRSDLAAQVRMQQAQMWMKQKEPAKAGQCYEDVINRFANAGPFVIDALIKAENILRSARDGPRVLALYEKAWSQMKKPHDMAGIFFQQSNWYRVGDLYAKRLDEAGRQGEAMKVRTAITVK